LIVTLSAGEYAIEPAAGDSPELLIQRADQALYAAKDEGRDRVYCFDPSSQTVVEA
jgi:PleD family two-component response regulator